MKFLYHLYQLFFALPLMLVSTILTALVTSIGCLLDFAQEEIREILINLKRVEFINRVKKDLYHQASEKNGIIYYYLNSDE